MFILIHSFKISFPAKKAIIHQPIIVDIIAHTIPIFGIKIRFSKKFIPAAIHKILTLCLIFHNPAKIGKNIWIKIFINMNHQE